VNLRTAALTLCALIAFASNSVLTRLALGSGEIDAATFTALRLSSGAIVLMFLVRDRRALWRAGGSGWREALALFAYAAPFSFAYLRIGAAAGALVLFGVVQLTMIGYAFVRGERPAVITWIGVALALTGLATLTLPAVTRLDTRGVLLMTIAGIAWASYSLAGRKSGEPLVTNARSFLWSTGLAVVLLLFMHDTAFATPRGIALAAISGGITSALGYAIWYRALPRLSVTQAAVAQLAVPIIAAIAAVVLLNERLTTRLIVSGACVLAGVALAVIRRSRNVSARASV